MSRQEEERRLAWELQLEAEAAAARRARLAHAGAELSEAKPKQFFRQKAKSHWRDKYKVHPAADVFPMLSDDELAKLGEDIKANGLQSPIICQVTARAPS
jgi:hypothetical protein